VGATVSRTFTAGAPGTYQYQSSGDGGRDEAMGLSGMLIVRSLTAGRGLPARTQRRPTAMCLQAPRPTMGGELEKASGEAHHGDRH